MQGTKFETDLKISLFDMKKMKDNANVLILGMRASGKSTLVRNILYHKQDCNIGGIFSKTEKLCKFYSDFCPADTIYHDFNKYIIMDKMNKMNNIINIMDDCLSSKGDWMKNQIIKDMMDKKHNFLNIFTFQYPLSFSKEFRENIDYVFIMNEQFISNVKRLKSYAPFITEFDDFNKILRRIMSIDNFNVMVIDNTINKYKYNISHTIDDSDELVGILDESCIPHLDNIKDRIFWYKAEEKLPHFEITNYEKYISIYNYYGKDLSSDSENIDDNESDDSLEKNDDNSKNNNDNSKNNNSKNNNDDLHYNNDITDSSDSSDASVKPLVESNMTITINKNNILINKNNISVNIIL